MEQILETFVYAFIITHIQRNVLPYFALKRTVPTGYVERVASAKINVRYCNNV